MEMCSDLLSTVSPMSHRTSAAGKALTSHSNLTLEPTGDVTAAGVIVTRGARAVKIIKQKH